MSNGNPKTLTSKPQRKHQRTTLFFWGHTRINPKPSEIQKNKRTDDNINKTSAKDVEKANLAEYKGSCFMRFIQQWSQEDSVLRLSWTTILMIALSLISGGIFFAIENNTKCQWSYFQSVWFVNTISTTIGYGSIYPCSAGGMVFSVIFAFIGVPINVVALSDVGKLLARLLHFLWNKLKRIYRRLKRLCRKQKNAVVLIKTADDDGGSEEIVPLRLAFIVACFWFMISATFFMLTEPMEMTFGTALYYVMISVTTIGFGDVTPKNYNLVFIQFFFIIIGISLFSMVINIVQDKVDALSDHVESLISKEYAKAQERGEKLAADDEVAARGHIRKLMKNQKGGGVLRLVMGKQMENRLVQDYLEKARKQVISTQTENIVYNKSILAFPDMVSDETQISTSMPNSVNRGTQLKWIPKVLTRMAPSKVIAVGVKTKPALVVFKRKVLPVPKPL